MEYINNLFDKIIAQGMRELGYDLNNGTEKEIIKRKDVKIKVQQAVRNTISEVINEKYPELKITNIKYYGSYSVTTNEGFEKCQGYDVLKPLKDIQKGDFIFVREVKENESIDDLWYYLVEWKNKTRLAYYDARLEKFIENDDDYTFKRTNKLIPANEVKICGVVRSWGSKPTTK